METLVRNFIARTINKLSPSSYQKRLQEGSTLTLPDEYSAAIDDKAATGASGNLGSTTTTAKQCEASRPDIGQAQQPAFSPAGLSTFKMLSEDNDLALTIQNEDADATYPQYTDGPSRTVTSSDGSKDCLALLLTRDMVANLNNIFSGSGNVDRLEEKVENASREADLAQIFLDQSLALLAGMERTDEINVIKLDMERAEKTLQKASLRRDRLEEELCTEKHNLAYCRGRSEDVLRRVFSDSQLLDEKHLVDEERSDNGLSQSVPNDEHSVHSRKSEETLLSFDGLNRCATLEEVGKTRRNLQSLQDNFDGREEEYDRDLQEYQQAVEDGSCDLPQSEFDRIYITNVRNLTACLKVAETEYKDAMARARALGMIDNEFEQESDFVDQVDDGYRESHEAEMAAGVDRFFIHSWMDATEETEDPLDDPEVDDSVDWDVKSVEISDSISMVAEGPGRVKIDRWRETCGL
ncbi:MAG: hypothetical protein M1830_003177 [Pleopsidium flavum]|nr:MAG: hypothetical protein M1830_003177 [Pleopsidium flavum]